MAINTKYKAIVVSDLHLGTKDSKAKEFIKFLDTHPTDLLILNGDIIDGWALKRGSKWRKHHTKVLIKLIKLSKKTRVIWIRGNHDDFLKDFIGFKFDGIEICEDFKLENFQRTSDGRYESKHYYIFHGDSIDVFITKYKWLAKIGSIGYDLALWVNRWYNRYRAWRGLPYRSISKDIKAGVKSATNYVNDFENMAIKMAEKNNCFGVICGHIHQPANHMIGNFHYLNSGDYIENLTALLFEENTWKIHEFNEV